MEAGAVIESRERAWEEREGGSRRIVIWGKKNLEYMSTTSAPSSTPPPLPPIVP